MSDKFLSKSEKKNNSDEEKEEIVAERVYVKDDIEEQDKEIVKNDEKNILKGDIEYDENQNYPNLANIPNRPDPAITIEEQEKIVSSLEENNDELDAIPNISVSENKVPSLEKTKNEDKKNYNLENQNLSIRNVLASKLNEIENFNPNKDPANKNIVRSEEELELHNLARELKNIKTPDDVNKVEKRIKKNDLYYTPDDIEDILGIRGLDNANKSLISKEEKKKAEIKENTIIEKTTESLEKKVFEKIKNIDSPVARITFNHGSSNLTESDLQKINKVANLFHQNKGKKILIVGHASSRTNYDMDLTKHAIVNFNISLERANKVMSKFSDIGMKSDLIELVAMSDREPLYTEIMPRLEAANRRAEIFIQY
tara:strand:- start:8194 stop:9303 length:1110 start_codon:yes stop_codon:yes gene_type:complete